MREYPIDYVLTNYLVGIGGWQYFNIPNKPPLKAYSKFFNFVEVNNTFYQYPSISTVERWRPTVPVCLHSLCTVFKNTNQNIRPDTSNTIPFAGNTFKPHNQLMSIFRKTEEGKGTKFIIELPAQS